MTNLICIIIAIAIAGLRIAGVHSLTYQAVAHVFVGWLIGAGAYELRSRSLSADISGLWKLGIALVLIVVEVICFMAFHFAGN